MSELKKLFVGALALACLTSCGGPVAAGFSGSPTGVPHLMATPEPTQTVTPNVMPTPAPAATPTPSSAPAANPSPQSTPASPLEHVRPGSPAYVAVSVATGWRSPAVVRSIDLPALANPVQVRQWLARMTLAERADLIGRGDTQVLLGERVEVLSLTGSWAQVVVPRQRTTLDSRGYPVWIPIGQLSAIAPAEAATVATVMVPTTWLLTGAGVATLEVSFGTSLPVLAGGGTTLELGLPGRRSLFANAGVVSVRPRDASPLSTDAASIIGSARRFLGLAYLWAGTSAYGLDCSGLVYTVYRAHGILLPRDADNQAMAGRAVARAALRPGDLVFFATNGYVHHVAIYTGNGQILDSPRTGGAVEVIPLATYSDYAGARRILP